MANDLFVPAKVGLGTALINWTTNKLKAILVDMNDAGPAAGAWVITNVSNVANPTITTSAAHGLAVGDRVAIFGVNGATGVNGNFDVASVPTTTTFTITASAPGAYTSGGYIANLSKTFLSEFVAAGGRIATSATLASPTFAAAAGGVATADAADGTFGTVTGDPSEAVIIVRAAAATADADLADTAQRLLVWIDTSTNLPITPNGGEITFTWNSAGIFSI